MPPYKYISATYHRKDGLFIKVLVRGLEETMQSQNQEVLASDLIIAKVM